ncbi:Methionine--tRNA ligase [Frankliniella fusca]|uniref:Methionine--tRNA ligase n=1 Tax=Frankliniella fusca TaxID=407009 RepID=A0AAE1HVT4_9NEOP|nr:Methionine--tRNA ligase [Frankliniella fusca]
MKSRYPLSNFLLEVYEPSFACWCEPTWTSLPQFPRFRALQSTGSLTQPFAKTPQPAVNTEASTSASELTEEEVERASQCTFVTESHSKKGTKGFTFNVPWDDLPIATLLTLKRREDKNEIAEPSEIENLKTAIAIKCKAAYKAHRESTGASQKTPGMSVYREVGRQVHERFKTCMRIEANKIVLESGKDRFTNSFKIAMENTHRDAPKAKKNMSVTIARGTVGVLAQKYNPPVNENERDEFLKAKETLKKMHNKSRSQWKMTEITALMHKTFSLQREDIVRAVENIKNLQNEINEEEEEEEKIDEGILYLKTDHPVLISGTELEKLKSEWPFLFHLEWQARHFQLLTGELVDLPLREFCDDQLDGNITFLVSQQDIVSNPAIKLTWEKYGSNEKVKFMIFIMMLANYLAEDHSSFIRCVEKTTLPYEIMYEENMTSGPCIIALDNNKYLAQRFYACIDKVVIFEAESSEEAFLALIMALFMFDCDYPALPHTMEYMERFENHDC